MYLVLALSLLTACTVSSRNPQQASQAKSVSVASSSSPSEEIQSIVLTDKTYNVTSNGRQWLADIGTVLLKGNVSQARLKIDLSRGNDDKGWSAIGMYVAPLAQGEGFTYPDESVYGTNLHFINAEWRGDCKRHISPESSFGVLKEHSNHLMVDLSAVPVTAQNTCDTNIRTIDVMSALNDGGVYLGFMPSSSGYHAKVTLEYVGEITASAF